MENGFHWGGINFKSLCKAVLSNIWMVFAAMAIVYLGLGIVGNRMYMPSYTSSCVVAVYPFHQMYTLESSTNTQTVSAAMEVLNSEMFNAGLKERLAGPEDSYFYSQQIDGTYILNLSASSSSPENAYRSLRTALDYYGEISSRLVGNNQVEILIEPDFPVSASNDSKLLKYRGIMTLLCGFAMGCYLVLTIVMRKTYKTTSAIRHDYRNVPFFTIRASASGQHRKRSAGVSNQEAMRKTALELLQAMRARNARSILVTSAAPQEGKTEFTFSLAKEMADYGSSVLVLTTDSRDAEKLELMGMSDHPQEAALSSLLKDGADLERAVVGIPGRNIKVILVTGNLVQEGFHYTAADIEQFLERAEQLADIILVDGWVWTGSRKDLNWKKAVDASLAVCGQDKADFYAVNRMMTALQEANPERENRRAGSQSGFLGCVLYGF